MTPVGSLPDMVVYAIERNMDHLARPGTYPG